MVNEGRFKRLDKLREQAEKIIKMQPEALQRLAIDDIGELIHELGVYQIQLEMQNEELQRAYSEIQESRDRYTDLYDFSPVGYFTFDNGGIIREVNLTGARQLGVRREYLINQHINRFLAGDDQDAFYLYQRQVFESKTRQSCELKLKRKDGTEFFAQLESAPVEDRHGQFQGQGNCMRTAVIDISERKRLEAEKRAFSAQFEAVLQQMPSAVVIIEASSEKPIFANDRVSEIFRHPAPVISSMKDYAKLKGFHPEDRCPLQLEEWPGVRSLLKGETVTDEEIDILRGDGTRCIISVRSAPVRDDDSNIAASVVVFTDITERRQAENMRSQLATLVESTDDGISSQTLDGIITSWNHGAEKIYGYSAQEVVGRSISIMFPPERLDELPEISRKLKAGESISNYETVRVRKDGTRININLTISPIKDKNGKTIGAVIIEHDITKRKRMEGELNQYRSYLEALVDSRAGELSKNQKQMANAQRLAHMGSWEWDIAADTMSWSEELGEIFGVRAQEKDLSFHQCLAKIIHPDDRNYVKGLFEKACHDREPFEYQHRIVRPDGSVRVVRGRGEVVFDDAGGKPLKIIGFSQDITEAKKAEDAMRTQAQIVDQVHDAVISTDLDGYVTSWNKGAERLYGYTKEEALERHISFLYPEDDQDDVLQNQVIAPFKEKGTHELETRTKRKTGEDIHVHLSLSFLRDNDGNIIGIVGSSMDITGRKRAEEERARIQVQLHQSQKMEAIGILAGGVAHDFNNLLTTIQGYISLAMMRIPDSDPVSRDLNQVRQAAGKAANLTRQLLLFSRKQPMEPSSLDLNETVHDLLKMFYRLIGEDITITTDLKSDLWPVLADEGTIEQVIMNLIVNAKDAMPQGGYLTIKTENITLNEENARAIPDGRTGKFVCLAIEDTGCGMDAKTTERIFEPFFTTKGVGKGTGLGLSVVYGIVKHHEGWINVWSEEGKGSIFRIFLPAFFVKMEEKKKEAVSLRELQGKGERILVVEDEEDVRRLTMRMLQTHNYIVQEASSGQEALDTFEREGGKFDLVLSDVVLPDQTGPALVDHLLLRQPKLKVLLVSGYTDQKSQWLLIHEKGFRFLQKPYELHILLRTLREVIEPPP
ncbi:MAG: PAS domain S-box protein [bacterium]